jgi:hypothetical protein
MRAKVTGEFTTLDPDDPKGRKNRTYRVDEEIDHPATAKACIENGFGVKIADRPARERQEGGKGTMFGRGKGRQQAEQVEETAEDKPAGEED